jgi:hypothetical protein
MLTASVTVSAIGGSLVRPNAFDNDWFLEAQASKYLHMEFCMSSADKFPNENSSQEDAYANNSFDGSR